MVLDVHREGGVTTLTINRPEALNALNSEVLTAIHAAVQETEGGSIIVTGAGKAFVAGADIAEMKDYGPEEAEAFSKRGQAAFQALQDFPGPTIAAVNGFALGGGLELALACDLLLCSEKAKLGLPEATLAVVPGFGGTQRLSRRVGPGMAKRLLFTGEMIDAATAGLMGLCAGVVSPEELMHEAHGIATKANRNGPLAIAACKRLVNDGLDMELKAAITMEAEAFGTIFGTEDQTEVMSAFLDKRKPAFVGR